MQSIVTIVIIYFINYCNTVFSNRVQNYIKKLNLFTVAILKCRISERKCMNPFMLIPQYLIQCYSLKFYDHLFDTTQREIPGYSNLMNTVKFVFDHIFRSELSLEELYWCPIFLVTGTIIINHSDL